MADSGPKEGMKGMAEEVKGKAKEAIGHLTGNEEMEHEGEAQQDKAANQRDSAKHEAEADAARAKAAADEQRQRMHQD